MVFKRRNKRSVLGWLREMVYPRGGFRRATRYVMHRMARLPDNPHRIARGVFAGSLIGFMPLPGLQFLGAWGAARLIRGNILAALLATFNSNPITTPFFAVGAITLGHWMLGVDTPLSSEAIGAAFANAGLDIWQNIRAIFTDDAAQWTGLVQFWKQIYWPYFIGAFGPGFVLSLIFYYITIPLVEAYQKARAAKSKERSEKRGRLKSALLDAAKRLKLKGDHESGEDDGPHIS